MTSSENSVAWDSASNFWKQNLQGILDKNGWYQAIGRGEVPHLRIGRRILVPCDALEQMLAAKNPEYEATPNSHSWQAYESRAEQPHLGRRDSD